MFLSPIKGSIEVKNILVNNILLFLLFVFLSPMVQADLYTAPNKIKRIRIHANAAFFGTTIQPTGTCNNYGEYFTFDHKTEAGKAYLSFLLTAKAADKDIVLWYKESTAPGTDHTSGCDGINTAVVTGIGLP